MSLWSNIRKLVAGGVRGLGAVFDAVATAFAGDPATRRRVAFSIALIALSAKMAKADGVVTRDEVAAFRSMFVVPAGEERNVVRLFDLARQDVAGYEAYAERIVRLYGDDRLALEDVIDGLFGIARADGSVHEAEYAYLERVAEIFGFDEQAFTRIAARHVVTGEGDPYLVLGVLRSDGFADIRRRYRALVAENHPDRVIGRGLPAEAVAVANDRLAAINRAYERIELERA